MFYSATTGGFYDTAIHGDNIPPDAVEITVDEHASLIDGQSSGKRIVPDGNGHPILVNPESLMTLGQVQFIKISGIYDAYQAAISQPVSFTTSGGVSKSFQADANSQDVLTKTTQGYGMAGSVPAGFFWVAADNTRVPFTLDDLKGLYAAMLAQGWDAFQHLQDQKSAINKATTVAQVEAVVW